MSTGLSAQEYWDKNSYGRKKWESVINFFLSPVSKKLIENLHLTSSMNVLDVATGTGEPGLTIAAMQPDLLVTGTDISEKMIEIANESAKEKGLYNYRAIRFDASFMPFPDDLFDAIVCRNGVMFFPHVSAGLKEMHRVLKVNGWVSVSTWGVLEKNLWISNVLDAITELTHHKSYNRHKPGMFYCMQPGTMTDWFETANFEDITEEEITGVVEFSSIDDYWLYVTTVSADVMNALKGIPDNMVDMIRENVLDKIRNHAISDKIYFQWSMRVTSATKH
ncbi:class I SAM-dependent methyltransferase [Chitinophaga sp. RAB17]|uniref:class I SAM-dependent methyltransferase n=1 Tax=Chitinophaga sp. RAB17 TaxID=3233049 RepID=UPI003F8E9D11